MSRFDYGLENDEIVDLNSNVIHPYFRDSLKLVDLIIGDQEVTLEFDKVIIFLKESQKTPKINIDPTQINRIHVHSVERMEYQYNPPLESRLSGFYYIPGVTNRLLSRDGLLIDMDGNKLYRWGKASRSKESVKGGYETQTIIAPGANVRSGVYKHRLLMLTFELCPSLPSERVINHLDGDPSNSTLDNLEWTTYSANTQHAYDNGLYPFKTTPIQRYNWKTGVVDSFMHVAECARLTGWDDSRIRARLAAGAMESGLLKKYSDGYVFRITGDDPDRKWDLDREILQVPRVRDVHVLDICSGEIKVFDTIVEAAAASNVSTKLADYYLKHKHVRPSEFGNVFRFSEDLPFPEYNEYQKKMASTNGKSIESGLIDRSGVEEKFYPKRSDFLKQSGMTVSQLDTLIKNNPLKYIVVKLNKEYLHSL